MTNLCFKFKSHPEDFFRNSKINRLPHPDIDSENFLVYFHSNYQSDSHVSFIDDLSKLLFDEFKNEVEKLNFIDKVGILTDSEILKNIFEIENELKSEAYRNFHNHILSNKLKIVFDNETN